MSGQRIGILGGTFDPPHRAHMAMAHAALERIPLDKVLFMPAPRPPHKMGESITEYETRARMVELAIAEEPGFELSRLEMELSGPSYTADLLKRYHEQNPHELFLILGADNMQEFASWRSPQVILHLATIVVFPRAGYRAALPVSGDASVILFEDPEIDVSSTGIRDAVRAGEDVESLVPERVREFILDNRVYG